MKTATIVWSAALAAALLDGPTPARAAVVTFDDRSGNTAQIPNGYAGFNWTNFYTESSDELVNSGYGPGTISPHNFAFPDARFFPTATSTISSTPDFNFVGAYLTSAWNDGLSVEVKGFNNSVLLYDTTMHPSATAPTFFTFNYANVDSLTFISSGGTPHPGYSNGSGVGYAMDNFTYAPVPEPAGFVLGGIGLVGFLACARRRMLPERVYCLPR